MLKTIGCVLLSIWMAESVAVPKLRLNDGREMPAIALGTFLGFNEKGILRSENKQFRDAVLHALKVGYRHFDTSPVYGTEAELGEALNMAFADGTVKREDVFVTTKLWNTHHSREQVVQGLNSSLQQLGLDYVDLYLMHWPIGLNADYSFSDVDFIETWQIMECIKEGGLAKSIGVSNFNKDQLQRLVQETVVQPAALEIEVHPQLTQEELVSYAQSKNITVLAYSPFGSVVKRFGSPPLAQNANQTLQEIAGKYGKTMPQVALRWLLDRNIAPIPKSVNPKRIEQNIDVFDFNLTEEERQKVSSLNQGIRYTLPSFWQEHPYYPFEKVANPMADPFRSNSFFKNKK